jgi:hypothetical protein
VAVEKLDTHKNGTILGDSNGQLLPTNCLWDIQARRNFGPLPTSEFLNSHVCSRYPRTRAIDRLKYRERERFSLPALFPQEELTLDGYLFTLCL